MKKNVPAVPRVLGVAAVAFVFFATGCGGARRALIIKSDPPDAEVCIKGSAQSEYFSNQKSCVGTTPFEAVRVKATNSDGEKREVSFSDLEGDKEHFYVVVSRPGYVSEVIEIPSKGWSHAVALRSEAAAQQAALANPVIMTTTGVPQQIPSVALQKGSIRATSEPNGALVYINGALKGNTPFTFEGGGGDAIRIKLEMEGYAPLEKVLTIEGGKNLTINFSLVAIPGAVPPPIPVQSAGGDGKATADQVPVNAEAQDAADFEKARAASVQKKQGIKKAPVKKPVQ